jgi:predicted phage-related endonuclease
MGTIVNVVQGSDAWHQFRLTHHGASEAAIMLGLSKNVKRSELIRMKATGIGKEFSDWVQKNVLDKGHEVEALARPIVERQIGEDLYPATYEDGKLSASLDGITLGGDIVFEHKQWAIDLAERVRQGVVPEDHLPQCQQILLVTGAKLVRFVVSDGTKENMVYAEVLPDYAWFQRIVDAWAQFEKDVAAYVPPTVVEPIEIVGSRPDQLPAIRSSVRGELILESNIKEWEAAALSYIKSVRDHELKTDEDFANADEAAKWCDASKQTLLGVRANLMSATGDVNTAVATLDRIASELDKTRIAFTNAIKTRKEARKEEMVITARRALDDHIAALNAELAPMRLLPVAADFPGAIKGLRSIASMQDALDTTLATAKIAADNQARGIRANVAHFQKAAAGLEFLFADLGQLVHKAADDFATVVGARVAKHRADEAEREAKRKADEARRIAEAEAKVRADEAARFAAEQQRKDEAAAAERARALKAEQAATDAAVVIQSPTPIPPTVTRPMPTAYASASAPATELPTLKLGQINERLGYTVTADLLAQLGFVAHTDRSAKLYRDSDFGAICAALAKHTLAVSAGLKEAA